MAFRFSLEAVLQFRRSQEQAERLKLEAMVSEQSLIRARIQELTEKARESRRLFEQRFATGVAGSELQHQAQQEANAAVARNQLRIRLAECEQRRVAQTQAFYQARRNREALEELRLAKLRVFLSREARLLQQELDDLFLMRRNFQDRD